MSYFSGASILRGNDWDKTISGEYLDGPWESNYCTNTNFLLFPNELNIGTFFVWISWFIV